MTGKDGEPCESASFRLSLLARRFLSKLALSTRQCGKQRPSLTIHCAAKTRSKEVAARLKAMIKRAAELVEGAATRVSLGQQKALKSQFMHYKRCHLLLFYKSHCI